MSDTVTGADAGFGELAGKICGFSALALAVVAIFVPVSGILVSCAASAIAVVAALLGESRTPALAAIVIGVNAFVMSPLLQMAGPTVPAFYVAILAAAPFGAIALTQRAPRYRFAIVLPIIWVLAAPAVVNSVAERRANEAGFGADLACQRGPHPAGTDVNAFCHGVGKLIRDGEPRPSYAVLAAVGLLPAGLAWLGYWLVFVRRRAG